MTDLLELHIPDDLTVSRDGEVIPLQSLTDDEILDVGELFVLFLLQFRESMRIN